jgi:hypothetical protein
LYSRTAFQSRLEIVGALASALRMFIRTSPTLTLLRMSLPKKYSRWWFSLLLKSGV